MRRRRGVARIPSYWFGWTSGSHRLAYYVRVYWECRKRATYKVWEQRRRRCVPEFSPVVFELYGLLGEHSVGTVTRLARRSAAMRGLHAGTEVKRWLELLGTRVQLENAMTLRDG